MAAWKRAGTCSLRLTPLSLVFPSRHYLHTDQRGQVVGLLFFFFLTCLCTFPIIPAFILSSRSCLFMPLLLFLLLLDIFRDELPSTAGGNLQKKKKNLEGGAVSVRQRVSLFLPSHFQEDLICSPHGTTSS